MQVQFQDFELSGVKVWTVDVSPAEDLTPQDRGRWIWTPLSCITNEENTLFTEEIRTGF